MAHYDLRLDLPARAFINAQLLSLLERGGTLDEAKQRLFSSEPYTAQFSPNDIARYQPHDHSLIISVLYCSVVVPREYLNFPADHAVYQECEAANVQGLFTDTEPAELSAHQFIRSLRNSVAHALFSIGEDERGILYQFWTERPPLFRTAIRHEALLQFVSFVGQRFSNAVLAEKSSSSAKKTV